MLTSSHSTILWPCIALPFPLEGVNAPANEPPASVGAAVAPAVVLSCSTLTRRQRRWHARGYLEEKHTHASTRSEHMSLYKINTRGTRSKTPPCFTRTLGATNPTGWGLRKFPATSFAADPFSRGINATDESVDMICPNCGA